MGDMTTIGEILEFAIGREAEAVEFYMAMADRAKDPATRTFFEYLVTEELEHKSRLEMEMMKEGLVARTVGVLPETCLDRTIVDLNEVRSQMDYQEALDMAIRKERLSFRLYARLAGLVAEAALSETLLSLAEQEVRHVTALEEQYEIVMTEQQQ